MYAQVNVLWWTPAGIAFDQDNGVTAAEASTYRVRLYVNNQSPVSVAATCMGNKAPWTCTAPTPALQLGNNVLTVTVQAPPVGGVEQPESPKSAPLLLFYAVNQVSKESVVMCTPGSYAVQRITDANKLAAAVNSVPFVKDIVSTANAIYVFSCVLQ